MVRDKTVRRLPRLAGIAKNNLFVIIVVFLTCVACGPATTSAEPTLAASPISPSPVPLLPTVAVTVQPATQATISVTPPLSLLPTEAVTVEMASPLTMTGAVLNAQLPIDDSVHDTMGLTNTQGISGTSPSIITPTRTTAPCDIETDVALASYPELQTYLGCAVEAAGFDPVAINEFGNGPDYDRFMLWFSSETQIYTLLPTQEWQQYPDTWTEDQPTFTCNPLDGEPTSPPLPRRGFNKIWCTVGELQTIMGMIEKEERLCQHTVMQRFQHGRLLACYEDATIRFFRIMDDGTWAQVLM